jgi:hypothetical protein
MLSFGRKGRRERRIRERGSPARGTIVDARPGGHASTRAGGVPWQVRLAVTPDAGAAFVAVADGVCPEGERPAVGGTVEVLHDPGAGDHVVLSGPIPTVAPQAVPGPAPVSSVVPAGGDADGVDPTALAGEILSAFGRRGATAGDGDDVIVHREVTINGQRVTPEPSGAARPDMSRDELRALARTDPGAVAHEVLRRVAAGQAKVAKVTTESVELGPGDDVGGTLRALRQAGILTDAQLEQITRHLR